MTILNTLFSLLPGIAFALIGLDASNIVLPLYTYMHFITHIHLHAKIFYTRDKHSNEILKQMKLIVRDEESSLILIQL